MSISSASEPEKVKYMNITIEKTVKKKKKPGAFVTIQL